MTAEPGDDGRRRVVIERLRPEVDCGRFPVKRVVGESVVARVDAFTDGHDQIACMLRYRRAESSQWRETPMRALRNDRWEGKFKTEAMGRYIYTVAAWVDAFLSFKHDLARREDKRDIKSALAYGAGLVEAASKRADDADDAARLRRIATSLVNRATLRKRRELALSGELETLMRRYPDRSRQGVYERELEVVVDRERARFSTWYELFPR